MKPYAGADGWWTGDECPLSSDGQYVKTYDHSWCSVGAIKKTPNTRSGVHAQCGCSKGHRYPLRPRQPGDGAPGN